MSGCSICKRCDGQERKRKMDALRQLRNEYRNIMFLSKQRKRLVNKDICLIASNCNGAMILHDLRLQFKSPFVNLWLRPKDFIKLLSSLREYMGYDLKFTTEEGIEYPVGLLKDIKIYFQHYKTEDGQVCLKCRNERLYTLIEVSDNGLGMSKSQIKKIFDPFYSSKNSNYNWGMGLYYVREVVKSHLGKMRVESTEGKGSKFYILIPKYE